MGKTGLHEALIINGPRNKTRIDQGLKIFRTDIRLERFCVHSADMTVQYMDSPRFSSNN